MRKVPTLALTILVFSGLAGCSTIAPPKLCHPGPIAQQQQTAVRFDPYPENEPGPVMVGVRPRDYQNPIAEPARARWQLGN
jgi:hypothetical protein